MYAFVLCILSISLARWIVMLSAYINTLGGCLEALLDKFCVESLSLPLTFVDVNILLFIPYAIITILQLNPSYP